MEVGLRKGGSQKVALCAKEQEGQQVGRSQHPGAALAATSAFMPAAAQS